MRFDVTPRARRRTHGRWLTLVAALVAVAGAATLGLFLASQQREATTARRAAPTTAAHVAAGSQRAGRRPAPLGHRGPERVPILMYHVIAPPLATAPFPGLYVPPAEFAAQMQALERAGYHAVTLDQVRASWLGGLPLPLRPIVLSFDNGYQTQYTKALPILRRLGWVGVENIQLTGLPPSQGGLGPRQVRALVAAGWELDTQGFSHANLVQLDASRLHYEVAVARSVIRQRYHVPVNWFCYPSGHYDATVIEAVKAAGYVGATTVAPGWARPADDPYRLPRLRVLGGTTGPALIALIADSRNNPEPPPVYGSYPKRE